MSDILERPFDQASYASTFASVKAVTAFSVATDFNGNKRIPSTAGSAAGGSRAVCASLLDRAETQAPAS